MLEKKPGLIYSGFSPDRVARELKPLLNFSSKGLSLSKLSRLIETNLVPHLMKYDHPGFLSMFNDVPESGAFLGGKYALKYNQGVTNWQVSPGGAMLEELCCQALCRLFGLSANADATFMYSGTYANQQAIYLALHRKAEESGFTYSKKGFSGFKDPASLKLLASRDTHFSVTHAIRMLGMGEESIVTLQVDQNRRIDLNHLERTLNRLSGQTPFCLVATAGTTSSGAIDPLYPIHRLCRERGIWLHVDGAYGLAYSLIPEYKDKFKGMEEADSVCWDPHKQLAVPIPNSILFLRKKEHFLPMALYSDYFNLKENKPNPGLKSPPSTRPLAALPLIATFLHLGVEKVIGQLRKPLAAIRKIHADLVREKDIQVGHSPDTGIICFRFSPPGVLERRLNRIQKQIFDQLMAEGRFSISVTRLDERMFLRLIAISPRATVDVMRNAVKRVMKVGYACLKK